MIIDQATVEVLEAAITTKAPGNFVTPVGTVFLYAKLKILNTQEYTDSDTYEAWWSKPNNYDAFLDSVEVAGLSLHRDTKTDEQVAASLVSMVFTTRRANSTKTKILADGRTASILGVLLCDRILGSTEVL